MIKIEEAKQELLKKSLDDIQRETAYKWASRALAARAMFEQNQQFMLDYHEYMHEALEHAALVEDGEFFMEIKTLFAPKEA